MLFPFYLRKNRGVYCTALFTQTFAFFLENCMSSIDW